MSDSYLKIVTYIVLIFAERITFETKLRTPSSFATRRRPKDPIGSITAAVLMSLWNLNWNWISRRECGGQAGGDCVWRLSGSLCQTLGDSHSTVWNLSGGATSKINYLFLNYGLGSTIIFNLVLMGQMNRDEISLWANQAEEIPNFYGSHYYHCVILPRPLVWSDAARPLPTHWGPLSSVDVVSGRLFSWQTKRKQVIPVNLFYGSQKCLLSAGRDNLSIEHYYAKTYGNGWIFNS